MEVMFNKLVTIIREYIDLKKDFDIIIEDKWNFHYSDRDIDYIIDTLDYGIGNLSYKDFCNIMNKEKEKIEKEQNEK